MTNYTKKQIEKLAKDLGINSVDKVCNCVRDMLELYSAEISNDENTSYKEIERIDSARRTILEMQDEL